MRRFTYLIEYASLRLTASLFAALPHAAALAAGWALAGFVFYVLRFRRTETIARIVGVFGASVTPRQARRIAWLSWRNLCFNAVEMMRAPRLSPAWLRRRTRGLDEAVERARTLIAAHGGLVIAVPHMGNWDLAGVACKQGGVAIFSIAGKQKNPYVNRWLNRARGRHMDVLERGSSSLRVILRRLREGGAFAILPDVRMPTPDLTVPFLGSPANLGRGMAQFARSANVPILPVILNRVGWTRHAANCHEPVFPDPAADRKADILRMTRTVIGHVEAAIRQHPEQWFWYNKRWVLKPLPTPARETRVTPVPDA